MRSESCSSDRSRRPKRKRMSRIDQHDTHAERARSARDATYVAERASAEGPSPALLRVQAARPQDPSPRVDGEAERAGNREVVAGQSAHPDPARDAVAVEAE